MALLTNKKETNLGKNGTCFECNEVLPDFLIWSSIGNKFGICPNCIHLFEGKEYWTIEPMKPAKILEKCSFCMENPADFIATGGQKYNQNTEFICQKCVGQLKNNGGFVSDCLSTGSMTPINPLSGQKNPCAEVVLPEKPVIQPAMEIPEFCEYCSKSSPTPPNPPAFLCKTKNAGITRFLCKKCLDLNPLFEDGTITPLGEDSGMKNQILPSFSSPHDHQQAAKNVWFCEQDNITGFDGTSSHFGNCYQMINEKNIEQSDEYSCDNHAGNLIKDGYKVRTYGDKELVKEMKAGKLDLHIPDCLLPYLNSPENGQVDSVKKYSDAGKHQSAVNNMWICEHSEDTGFDGTTKHYGHCYKLANQNDDHRFACDNHAGKFVEKKFLVESYGTFDYWNKNFNEKPVNLHIPDCLKPYIPGTIENCEFKKMGWENYDWAAKVNKKWGFSGPCNGQQLGIINFNKPLCKAHYEFCQEMNKIGTFAEISPLSGQKPAKPVKKKIAPPPPPYTVRTQKAKGLQALKDTYFPVPGFQIFDVKKTNPDELVGKFVRPCPMRPRHGFVDSRTVKTREDAEKIITETLAADPEAEFLLMDYVPAPFSGIWTPGYLAIGTGTDGATAGKTAITIPIMGDYLNTSSYGKSARSKAGIESAPYVEILWRKMSQNYEGLTVQLRDGPKLPEGSEDYIPSEFTVEHVILADGDLLEWEEKMRHTACNSVVWHPNGTMASHYAIHAVLNKVPLLITREPKVGEKLKPTENGPGEVNIDLIRAGFAMACEHETSMQEAAYFMLLGCHQTGQWLGKFDILLGASMGFAYRLAMTAALGEERHYDKSSSTGSRDAVYKKYWMKADSQTGRTKFLDALEKFLNGHLWPGSNYGGKAWYQFTSQAVIMYNSLIRKDHKTAMEAMNVLINAAHNSGWGFNKFISQSEMTQTAKNPIYSGFRVGPGLYQILTATNETVKSAARSFWKRKELALPTDKGTGMGKLKSPISGHDDEDDDEDHESACEDPDCNECHPKPPHIYSESCGCDNCKKQKWQMSASKPQVVTQAHVKVVSNKKGTDSIAHIQYKSASCEGGPYYYTKDIKPAPKPILDMYKAHIGKFDTSYAGSETPYIVMEKIGLEIDNLGYPKNEAGWGLVDPSGKWTKLLNLEVTPNAS